MPAAIKESADYPLSRQPMMLASYHKQAKLCHITGDIHILYETSQIWEDMKCKYAGILNITII